TGVGLFMNYITAKWWTVHFVMWFGSRYSFTYNQSGLFIGVPLFVLGCLLVFPTTTVLIKRLNPKPQFV
ncbi:8474_t:CDS:1, partial [Racocetra persica]